MWVNTLLIIGAAFVVSCLGVVIVNLVLSHDGVFASEHITSFEQGKNQAVEVTLSDWHSRRVGQRLLDGAAALLSTQL
ncbi:MAG: hypothetical protein ACO1RT_18060 [Planctomycetaceae bacterium]